MKCSDLKESGDFSSIFSTISRLGGFGKLGNVYLKTKFYVSRLLDLDESGAFHSISSPIIGTMKAQAARGFHLTPRLA